TFESSYITKDGGTLPVEVKVNYLEFTGGKYCCAIARDICDRKAAELALLEAKEQLQAVLDAVPGFVSWVSSDLRYLGVNKHLAAAYKLQAETFIGQKVGFLDTSPLFNNLVYEFFASDETTVSQEVTASFQDTNKTYLIVAQKYHKNTTAVFVGLDVTERKQTLLALQESEDRLRQQAAKLEQTLLILQRTQTQLIQTEKMSFLGQLMAGIAHEINNPVSFISGNIGHASGYINDLMELVELYQKNHPNPAAEVQFRIAELDLEFIKKDVLKLLQSMKVGSERIRDVVRSLRLFSRPDATEMKPADIHEGLDSTLLILQNRLQAKGGRPGINLIKEYGNLPKVECYAGQLNQVFMHLLTNAIDALEEGSKHTEKPSTIARHGVSHTDISETEIWYPEIRIRTEVVEENAIAIAISDNGPGMNQEILACIFDPLFTTKSPGTSTGLGLAISHHLIVENHGGQLYCFSQPGQGTELIVQLAIENSL
ncbi:MAG: PAS domain-containing sensor histidine kinase, partial [Microcoleus sp.]